MQPNSPVAGVVSDDVSITCDIIPQLTFISYNELHFIQGLIQFCGQLRSCSHHLRTQLWRRQVSWDLQQLAGHVLLLCRILTPKARMFQAPGLLQPQDPVVATFPAVPSSQTSSGPQGLLQGRAFSLCYLDQAEGCGNIRAPIQRHLCHWSPDLLIRPPWWRGAKPAECWPDWAGNSIADHHRQSQNHHKACRWVSACGVACRGRRPDHTARGTRPGASICRSCPHRAAPICWTGKSPHALLESWASKKAITSHQYIINVGWTKVKRVQ